MARRTLSRRMLLTDLGAAGLGVVILGSCGGSSDGSSGTAGEGADVAATDPPGTALATAVGSDPEQPAETDPPADAAPATLRFQHVGIDFVSAFVLLRGSEAAIVDTGVPGSGPLILDGLAALDAGWSNVRHVVLTHRHGDHVGGLSDVLAEATSATVYAGEGDIAGIQSAQPLQAIGDGDEVLGLGVLDTPGHTPGSISLFDTETGLLVAGDAINGDGAGSLIGPNPDFTPDMDTALASVAKLAALEAQVAAFGHGGPPVDTDVMAQLAAIAAG